MMALRYWLLPAIIAAVFMVPAASAAQGRDCGDYDSQIWAQSIYESDPTRFAALDPDGNGLACEAFDPGAAPAWWTTEIPAGSVPVQLISVTDGDTIRVDVGGRNEPVRLILIDTPETNDPNNAPECYGQEATSYLDLLLSLGGDLYLESDVSDRDQYDRLLRYAWLDFGDGEVYLVNEAMVRSGFAAQSTFPPDVKYEEEIREAARFAREHGYGLWAGCLTDGEGDTNELSDGQSIVAAPEAEPAAVVAEPIQDAPEPAPVSEECEASYPDVCIPPAWVSGDLDCGDVGARRFTVYPPDSHGFDGDYDGVGCESG